MLIYDYYHRVRYRECDPMRIVYHSHYLDYFEAARTEALRSIGLPYKEIEDAGFIMPIVEAYVRYHQPAQYDDLLQVKALIAEPPSSRIRIDYEVRRMVGETLDPKLLISGRTDLCFVDTARSRPIRVPSMIGDVFEQAWKKLKED
jgi:acyl-CoA thioester hydrolase